MGKTNNNIEINGKKYDVNTGKVVGGSIDGFVKTRVTHPAPTIVHPAAPVAHPIKKPTMSDVKRAPAHDHKRAPETSKTLMRSAVKKPGDSLKRHVKAQVATTALVKQPVAPKLSIASVDPQRLKHAKTTPKSALIGHFNSNDKPQLVSFPEPQFAAPAYAAPVAVAGNTQPWATSQKAPKAKPTTDDLFQKAIERANSHLEPALATRKKSKARRAARVLAISGSTVAAVLAVGVIAYYKVPDVKLQVASVRAGFTVDLPNYRPAGFFATSLSSGSGQAVSASFNDDTGSHPYVLTEKKSTWNSDTLRDSFVAPLDSQYQTVQTISGRTVYLYGRGNAAWVDSGIWYQVTSNGNLTNDEVLKIVASL